ncbi:DUF5333 domain-containing protein [Limimaricola cinnabarinus]|jgi:hypothetical protein|uniref:DUF5333 domain-containing protein n=1 Tax=Limimaricola cinnabarinus TaxID=1125964 RepID=A0A2G1MKX8_9RHOB|nr:DUF5333 domain-containing protein [Limimaricola cinnabarinus]PHP29347.1 hypothetical protein CJ301_02460 [Limimaricola cinnabarinus]
MTIPHIARTAALILGFTIAAGATAALPALRDNAKIREGLISTAIAYEIGRKCDGIDSRWFTGIAYLNSLRNHAFELGYSREQVAAFIDNEAEKDRLEAEARARLRQKGGVEGDWESYCAVGRAEMAAGSQIGALLK